MIELIGAALGGIFRIIPEVMKYLDAKLARKHELDLLDKNMSYDKLRGDMAINEIEVKGQQDWNKGALDTLVESVKAQKLDFTPTGNSKVDALLSFTVFLNTSVRPIITYWFFGLYCAAKIAMFIGLMQGDVKIIDAILLIWKEEDLALLAGILNFWFLGRVFDKVK